MTSAQSQSAQSELELAHWLDSPTVRALILRIATEMPTSGPDPQFVQSLRKQFSAPQSHALLTQAQLQLRATAKFPFAQDLLLTTKGYEQATDWSIARYKAARFAQSSAPNLIVDLGCGLGSDSWAMSQVAAIQAIELDPVTAFFAECNLSQMQRLLTAKFSTQVLCQDCRQLELSPNTAWHLDPDRRAQGPRTTDWQYLEPGLETIARLLQMAPRGVLKTAPATPDLPPQFTPVTYQREWISSRRECRQQVFWFQPHELEFDAKLCRATQVGPSASTVSVTDTVSQYLGLSTLRIADPWQELQADSFTGVPEQFAEPGTQWQEFLYEPDPAILAAKLTGALAQSLELTQVVPSVPYLTGNRLIRHPLLSGYRLLAELPWRLERVREYLAAHELGQITVKKRSVELDPATIQRQLNNPHWPTAAVIILLSQDQSIRCLIAQDIE